MSALLVAMTVAGTVAYFTSTDAKDNAVAAGKASIELVEFKREDISKNGGAEKLVKFATDENHVLIPASGSEYSKPDYVLFDEARVGEKMKINGVNTDSYKVNLWDHDALTNEIDKMVFVKNTGNTDVYVRICFAFEAGNYVRLDRFKAMVHLNKNESDWMEWKWDNNLYDIDGTRYFIAWATYNASVAPDEYTKISLSQIALDYSALNDHVRAFVDSYDVKAFAQGVQADSGMTADTALKNTFGDKIPFDNVKKVKFTDLNTAIHYLNGENYSANKITSNVTSVTFGLTKDYSAKVAGCEGVLVANKKSVVDNKGNVTIPEADFTAYAYYVPNGENYDIYVLADNWKIYAPNASNWLFSGMSALTKVDTKNLDFSYVTNMQGVFAGCGVLEELDVSDWNVTGKVERIDQMFDNCYALTTLDCSNWDVSGVSNMKWAFRGCTGLTNLDVSYWEVGKVNAFTNMFTGCKALKTIPVDTWTWDGDPGQNAKVDMQYMFSKCSGLTSLDLSGWDVGKVTTMDHMFLECTSLTSVNVGGWNVGNVSTITNMFNGCYELSDLDLSSWKFVKVIDMTAMFQNCFSLKTIDLSGWDMGANTGNIGMYRMFKMEPNKGDYRSELATIYVNKSWINTKISSSYEMFLNCFELKGGGTTPTSYDSNNIDFNYAHIDGKDGKPGYLTQK